MFTKRACAREVKISEGIRIIRARFIHASCHYSTRTVQPVVAGVTNAFIYICTSTEYSYEYRDVLGSVVRVHACGTVGLYSSVGCGTTGAPVTLRVNPYCPPPYPCPLVPPQIQSCETATSHFYILRIVAWVCSTSPSPSVPLGVKHRDF